MVFSLAGEIRASGKPIRARIRLEPVEAGGGARVKRFGKQVDLPVGGQRKHVDELHRRAVERRGGRTGLHQLAREMRRQPAGDSEERVGFVLRVAEAEPAREVREDLGVRPRLADRLDHGPDELQADRAVSLRDVVVLEKRRRRQQDVRVPRGVGEDLLEDDGEEILALQPFEHAVLIGHRRQRVAVVDEQHLDRRVPELEQRAAEMVHVDEAGGRLGRVVDPRRRLDAERGGVAHRVAAAADAELAADRRQRENSGRGAAAVAVALESPAAAHQRRRGLAVELREAGERRGVDSRDLRRPRRSSIRPRARAIRRRLACARRGSARRRILPRTGSGAARARPADRFRAAAPGAGPPGARARSSADRSRPAWRRPSAPALTKGTR